MKAVPRNDRLPAEALPPLRDVIERASGIALGPDAHTQLADVVRERMRALRMTDVWEYALLVLDGAGAGEERKRLVAGVVVGETSFFRTPEQFRLLHDSLLPALAAAGSRFPLRILSAGCATGEEPYSIAVCALETFRGRFVEPVRILATDIRRDYLDAAERGVYPEPAVTGSVPLHLRKYFKPFRPGLLKVADEVRRLVTFEEGNLADPASFSGAFGPFDIIFCRNVTIYFRPETTRKVVAKFGESLVPGGMLFLGHSETLWGISDAFAVEKRDGAYFFRKENHSMLPGTADPSAAAGARPAALPPVPPVPGCAPAPPGEAEEGAAEAMAFVRKAESLADRDDADAADEACRRALALDARCPEAAYLLAVVLRRRHRYEEALSFAVRVLSVDPRFVMAGVEAAECLTLMGRNEEAALRWRDVFLLLDGEVRFPRLSPATGLNPRTLREYVTSAASRK